MQGLISIGIISEAVTRFPKHQETHWEVVYYTHGRGTLEVGDETFLYSPGVIVCQPPNTPHSEYAEEGYRNIHLTVRMMDDFGKRVPVFNVSLIIQSIVGVLTVVVVE